MVSMKLLRHGQAWVIAPPARQVDDNTPSAFYIKLLTFVKAHSEAIVKQTSLPIHDIQIPDHAPLHHI